MSDLKRYLAVALATVTFSTVVARATQNELVPPTSGIFTGVQYSQKIGDAFRSLASCNKGPTAPANVGGAAVDGLCWIDDSTSPWIVKQYVNGGWAVTGALDPATSAAIGAIGGGLATIAAAATVDLGSVPQANVTISGAATITSFGSSAPDGIEKTIRFDNAAILTPSGALLVPGGYPLTTAAGDRAKVTHLGSGNWEITTFTRASGIPVDVSAVGKYDFTAAESVPPLHVAAYGQALARSSYPAYLAKATRAQNGTRTSGNATITSVANTSGFGPGMPVESTGVNAGCTIASVTSSSITLNSSSCVTSSGTSPVTVFVHGYGTGGSSSTVGVDDCRGRALAGRDRNDPGSLANRLTASYFGADSSIFAASGGSQNATLTLAQLPTGITSTGTASVLTVGSQSFPALAGGNTISGVQIAGSGSGTAWVPVVFSPTNLWGTQNSASGTASVTSSNTSGAAHAVASPMLIAECVVRVIP